MALAQYEGPVFVRTPDGLAYPAHVQVSGLNTAYSSIASSVSINAEEVGMTDEFMGILYVDEGEGNDEEERS